MANLKCNPDGTFPRPKPRKLKPDQIDLKSCILYNDKGDMKCFSDDLWALHLWHAKQEGIKILKMLYDDKEILVDLDNNKEILDSMDKIQEILGYPMSYSRRGDEFDRIIMPMIHAAYP
jgi:hypothetical protein